VKKVQAKPAAALV